MLINKKTLEYLAEISRVELDKKHEEKMLSDLRKILEHFEELKEVNTEGVEPLAGGTIGMNVFREDEQATSDRRQDKRENLIDAFPEEKDRFLKVPPIFQNNE